MALPGCGNPSHSSQPTAQTQETGADGKAQSATGKTGATQESAVGSQTQAVPREIAVDLGHGVKLELVLISAGSFMMGSDESAEELVQFFNTNYGADLKAERYKPEHPCHRVKITRPFYLGRYHVTRGQFRQFVEATGYQTDAEKDGTGAMEFNGETFEQKPEFTWRNASFAQTDEHPVVNVSWNDAAAFCDWLSRKAVQAYRLPSEAQWEYACRAGTTTRYYSGDDPETLAQVGNVADATAKTRFPGWKSTLQAGDGYVFTAPVGRFRPNAWGLYDMPGNAWQWCADRYNEDYYAASPVDDPKGPDSGVYHVLRGGSWYGGPHLCRSANRFRSAPDGRGNFIGFRIAKTI